MLDIGLWAFWVIWLVYMIGGCIELKNIRRWATLTQYDVLSPAERRHLKNTLKAYDPYE